MLQDPNLPPMNPKETSLMTHPDASMKMYDINKLTILKVDKQGTQTSRPKKEIGDDTQGLALKK